MRRINIIAEGRTEVKFIEKILSEYHLFKDNEIYLSAITIETSRGHKGGDIQFHKRYKKEVKRLLKEKDNPIVSSLIDFFRLYKDFPSYDNSKKITNKYEKIKFLEDSIAKEIEKEIGIDAYRFLPYIQLHEFEALLFSDIKGLKTIILSNLC